MGALGAAVPTDFEESSFCTLNFRAKVSLPSVFKAVQLEIVLKNKQIVSGVPD